MHPIQDIISRYKGGAHAGIFSNCTANEFALRAVMRRCKKAGIPALIEATANQVNQDGGYTGQKPLDFYNWCLEIAKKENFDTSMLILGGDHLGPLTWTQLDETEAMEKAGVLVYEYVYAGFTKIHIDTSMRLASDDLNERLSDEVIARRGAELCAKAEEAFADRKKDFPNAPAPIYVIGSEVPIPGGAQEHEELQVTDSKACLETIDTFKQAFMRKDLEKAWDRVIAVVVQPGVEFSEDEVFAYNSDKAKELCQTVKNQQFVFEGHSTDYQPKQALFEMVRDGIVILKVGPALTFALREALFALENIETTLLPNNGGTPLSNFVLVLEEAMMENPGNWNKHYHGNEHELKIKRAYGFSDRARYYLNIQSVQDAISRLAKNLGDPIPLPLLSQFMPIQYARVRDGLIDNNFDELVLDRIGDCIDDYIFALGA